MAARDAWSGDTRHTQETNARGVCLGIIYRTQEKNNAYSFQHHVTPRCITRPAELQHALVAAAKLTDNQRVCNCESSKYVGLPPITSARRATTLLSEVFRMVRRDKNSLDDALSSVVCEDFLTLMQTCPAF